jgi:RNA polymerase sigma-70 factor (ECF subfamily)
MPAKPTPGNAPISHSLEGSSDSFPGSSSAQLSNQARVQSSVSSVAIDRGLLAMNGSAPRASATPVFESFPEATNDAEVMLRVKAGDDSAFEYLVQKYRRPMVSFMYRMSHNAAAAEDLAQEVFLRVYRSRGNYEPSAKFSTWLYRIATNLAVNHARDTRHERPENTVSIDEPDKETGLTVDVPDGTLSAEETILRRERMAAIRQRVQALPERQRVAVLMHKYQQMDYRQIAEVLKLSESATKSLLFRAYETLRVQLKEFV